MTRRAAWHMARTRGRMWLVDYHEHGVPRGWQYVGHDYAALWGGLLLVVVRRKDRLRKAGWVSELRLQRGFTIRVKERRTLGTIVGVV